MSPLADFADALARTPLSQTLQAVGWAVPTVQSLHILAIALVIAPAILLTLRLAAGRATAAPRGALMTIMAAGLAALLASGALLIVAEPRRELLSAVFQAKMALVLLAASLTAWLHHGAARRSASALRVVAVLCLLLWVAVIFCGRWIAYVDHA